MTIKQISDELGVVALTVMRDLGKEKGEKVEKKK